MNPRYYFLLFLLIACMAGCKTPYIFDPIYEIHSQVANSGKVFIANVNRSLLIDFENQNSFELPVPSTSGQIVGIDKFQDRLYSVTNSGNHLYRLNFDDLLWEHVMSKDVGTEALQFDREGSHMYYVVFNDNDSLNGGGFSYGFDKINLETEEQENVIPAGRFNHYKLNVHTNDIAMAFAGSREGYGGIYVHFHATGEQRMIHQAVEKGFTSFVNITWIDQGKKLVFVDREVSTLYIWDAATDQVSNMSISERVWDIAFSPDGTQVVYSTYNPTAVFIGDWDPNSSQFRRNTDLLVDLGDLGGVHHLFWW